MAENNQNSFSEDAIERARIDLSLRHPVMFFFTSGAMWLVVAVVLGLLSSLKMHWPALPSWLPFNNIYEGWSCFSIGRVHAAHMSALVYGWAFQAAFGIIVWLMARLSRRESKHAISTLVAGHVWNVIISLGVLSILAGKGSGKAWMELPAFVWPVLLACYFVIIIWPTVQFFTRSSGHIYVSQWYLFAAILWLPWLMASAYILGFVIEGHPLMVTAVTEWFKGGIMYLFLLPVGIGSAYYLVPKVTGKSVHSYDLALYGFWTLAFVAPAMGLQKLAGAPIPTYITYMATAAHVLFLIPALTVGVNLLNTMKGETSIIEQSPTLRCSTAGVIGLLILGALGALLSFPTSLRYTQFSLTGYGTDVLAVYGCFSMCAFGMIYFVVPRLTRREWLSQRFIRWHFLLSMYGVGSIVGFSMIGGLIQGMAQESYFRPWIDAAKSGYAFAVGTSFAWAFLSLANAIFLLHLLLMWLRLGRRSENPTLLTPTHHVHEEHEPEPQTTRA